MIEPPLMLLHLAPGLRRIVDPADIYVLEADGAATRVRLRGSRALVDVRPLAELESLLASWHFLRIHREYLINPRRVREVRRRENGEDWEVKMEPPVNRVLPVSRGRLREVWKAFGE